MRRSWYLLLVLFLSYPYTSTARTIKVHGNASSLESAVSRARDGDKIIVSPGSYRLHNPLRLAANVILRSEKGPGSTILIGNATAPVILVEEKMSPRIAGFTIGSDAVPKPENLTLKGGGIYVAKGAHPEIKGNWIIGNTAVFGAGIYCDQNSHARIIQNTLEGNHAIGAGGGLFLFKSACNVIQNTLVRNQANSAGGAIFASGDSSMITNSIFWKNHALAGGALHLKESYCNVINCTIVGNSASYGGGIFLAKGASRLINLILWANRDDLYYMGTKAISRPEYSDIEDADFRGRNGNISANPLFVAFQSGDFHLRKTSPCLDKGDPNPIYMDPDRSRNDMGAYGGPQAMD